MKERRSKTENPLCRRQTFSLFLALFATEADDNAREITARAVAKRRQRQRRERRSEREEERENNLELKLRKLRALFRAAEHIVTMILRLFLSLEGERRIKEREIMTRRDDELIQSWIDRYSVGNALGWSFSDGSRGLMNSRMIERMEVECKRLDLSKEIFQSARERCWSESSTN